MQNSKSSLSSRVLVRRLSAHLDLIAGQIYDIEIDLGAMLAVSETREKISITKTQKLDFARQSLEDCAVMLHLVAAPNTSDLGMIDGAEQLAARLKLETTKALMRRENTHAEPSADGEIDLF